MGRSKKKIVISVSAIVLVSAICLFFLLAVRNMGDMQDEYKIAVTKAPARAAFKASGEQSSSASVHNNESINDKFAQMGLSLEDELVKELQKYYGATISEKSTQASLYDIRKNIIGSRPDGREFFYKILKRAFPDLADEIMETLDKLDLYNQWLMENDAVLAQMSEEEKMAALWKKRIELFGDDAKEIWIGEVMATDERRARVQDALTFIDESQETTLDEKLQLYQDVLNETYKDTPEAYLLDLKPMLAQVFFSIDSVQNELKKMTPKQRQQTINKIRRDMGIPQKQIEAMEKIDADNNHRWEVGLKYMEERKRVVSQYQGEEQKEQLKALREKYFGDEARTIELEEEKDGFFRFKRPRVFGRN